MTVDRVLHALTEVEQPSWKMVVTDGVIDSRLAIPGSLFIALPGDEKDGHDFVGEAFENGAVVALVDRDVEIEVPLIDVRTPFDTSILENVQPPVCLLTDNTMAALQKVAQTWRAQLKVRVIGITGSVGKSTTKELTAEVLERRYRTLKNPGNLNNEIGLPLSILRLREEHERAILEMGFYVPGEIALLCDIAQPEVGVVTNVSQVHLERAGSFEAIVEGKAELVQSLPPAPDGVAVLNYDEELVRDMANLTEASVFYYGLSPEADLWASDVEGLGLEGVRFVLHYRGERMHVRVPLLGRHSVHTALRAAAVGITEDLTWDEILAGLQDTQAQLRLVAVEGPQGSLILDDTYNSAPPSAIAALNLLSELDGRKIAVMGDMLELGDFEERGHRMVGARAAEVADELVVIGDRARWISDEAQKAGLASGSVYELETSTVAIEFLQEMIEPDDVILVKGSRGMGMDQIVATLEVTP